MQDLPTLRLQTADGEEIALADFQGTPVLLVFLRHLG